MQYKYKAIHFMPGMFSGKKTARRTCRFIQVRFLFFLCLLLVLWTGAMRVQAQDFTLLRLEGKDTIDNVSAYRFRLWIKNVSPDSLTYNVELNYSTEWYPADSHPFGFFDLEKLAPGDSISKEIGFPDTSITPPVNPGTNIVVVWPTGTSLIPDTVTKKVFYKPTVCHTSDWNKNQAAIELFPVPCSTALYFKNVSKLQVESICVYNAIGQAMIRKAGNVNSINVEQLPDGIYFIDIRIKGTAPLIRKFSKSSSMKTSG